MESAINGNWIGAVISLPAAAAVIFAVRMGMSFWAEERKEIHEERKATNATIVQIVDRMERVAEGHDAALKENTDRLSVMSVTMATALAESSGNCRRAQDRMDQASAELGRRKNDEHPPGVIHVE